MNVELTILDLLLTPTFMLLAFMYATYIRGKYVYTHPEYKYYVPAMMIRMMGGITLGLIYFFYYGGGDTINYMQSSVCCAKLFFRDPKSMFEFWSGDMANIKYMFTDDTGYPIYKPKDSHAFFVVKLVTPLVIVGFYSYFATVILVSAVTFSGLWKLFQTFLFEFPKLSKELAIACLFIPSCVFWGSGIMKDSFTISAVGWYTYGFYFFFIKKRFKFKYALCLLLAAYVILAIKPYVFFALLPGSILWLSNTQVSKISNRIIRRLASPLLLGVAGLVGFFALQLMGDALGDYRLETVLDKAVITQQDMKASYYHGKTFDIGDFDASTGGVVAKAPMAIFAGIFRPAIWDVRNALMLVSSLENTYLLIMTLFLLVKLKFLGFFSYINKNPLLLFSILFSVFFAFSVGLTVANFGSLVRLRIPELPFFVASILIIRHYYEEKSGRKLRF